MEIRGEGTSAATARRGAPLSAAPKMARTSMRPSDSRAHGSGGREYRRRMGLRIRTTGPPAAGVRRSTRPQELAKVLDGAGIEITVGRRSRRTAPRTLLDWSRVRGAPPLRENSDPGREGQDTPRVHWTGA